MEYIRDCLFNCVKAYGIDSVWTVMKSSGLIHFKPVICNPNEIHWSLIDKTFKNSKEWVRLCDW